MRTTNTYRISPITILLGLVVVVSLTSYYMLANPTTTTIKEDTKTKTHSSIENTKETSEETTSISTFIEEEGDDLTIDVDCDLCRTQCTLEEDNTNKCDGSIANEAIPNLVHLVKVDGNTYPFDFYHWLIVKAATLTIKPTKIYLHGDIEPTDEWYLKAKKYLTFNKVTPPTKTPNGKDIQLMQHKSDFVRLEVLLEYGGIYLDLDAIPLKSFDRLLKSGYDTILGRQKGGTAAVGLMVAQKNSTLMREFLNEGLRVFDSGWTTHSVNLISRLIYKQEYRDTVLMLDQNSFFPFSWQEGDLAQLLQPGNQPFDWGLSYALHLFRSVSHQKFQMLPEDGVSYLLKGDSNFGRAVKWIVEQAVKDGDI